MCVLLVIGGCAIDELRIGTASSEGCTVFLHDPRTSTTRSMTDYQSIVNSGTEGTFVFDSPWILAKDEN